MFFSGGWLEGSKRLPEKCLPKITCRIVKFRDISKKSRFGGWVENRNSPQNVGSASSGGAGREKRLLLPCM